MREILGVIGEALVDVVMSDTAETRSHPGGSPLNVAVGLARLGEQVIFAGRYGRDAYGELIDAYLRDSSVTPLLAPDDRPTPVARAILDPTGAASYEFDLIWELEEAELMAGLATDQLLHVHTGSIGAVLDPGATTVLEALKKLRPAATISYDPNCRPSILPNRAEYRARVEEFVALADIVHASDEDLAWLYPERSLEATLHAWALLGSGTETATLTGGRLVVLTRGAQSILAVTTESARRLGAEPLVDEPIVPVQIADTVGAGDSFTSALLVALKDQGLLGVGARSQLRQLPTAQTQRVVRYAAHASALTSSRPGANAPTREELENAIRRDHS